MRKHPITIQSFMIVGSLGAWLLGCPVWSEEGDGPNPLPVADAGTPTDTVTQADAGSPDDAGSTGALYGLPPVDAGKDGSIGIRYGSPPRPDAGF